MRLKQYKKKTIGLYLSRELIIIILGIIFSFIIVEYLNNRFNNVMMPIVEAKVKKYISTIINDATDGIKFDVNLFTIEKSDTNEIKMITYDSYEATKLINEITHNIQDKLDILEDINSYNSENYIITEVPLGVIFKNSMLRNFGPRIKVRMELVGDILSELQTEVKPYGINNALVEVRVRIMANARVIMPLSSNEIQVINMIPISINIVNGRVPDGYMYSYK